MTRGGFGWLFAPALCMLPMSDARALCLLCTCGLTASGVTFGTYDPFAPSSNNATGTVTATCSLSGTLSVLVSYQIQLGSGMSGSFTNRQMAFGASRLNYNLYSDTAHTTIWGDGTGSSQATDDSYLLGVGSATSRTYTIYGQIPLHQNIAPGNYSDNIVVTIIY